MKKLLALLILNFAFSNSYNDMLFSNSYGTVQKAINLGADVNVIVHESTPLYNAARKNNTQIAKLLLNNSADPNIKTRGETPLHKAVQNGNISLTEALLDVDADPNIKDSANGNTPLQYAVQTYNQKMISILVKYDADLLSINKYGDTPASNILRQVSIPATVIQNDHLIVQSSPFSIAKGSVGLSVKNNTNYPIIVSGVALYVNGELINQANVNRRINPGVNSGVASILIPKEAYKQVKIEKNGTSDMKYGFAIRYKINNKNETLYDSTRSTLKLW